MVDQSMDFESVHNSGPLRPGLGALTVLYLHANPPSHPLLAVSSILYVLFETLAPKDARISGVGLASGSATGRCMAFWLPVAEAGESYCVLTHPRVTVSPLDARVGRNLQEPDLSHCSSGVFQPSLMHYLPFRPAHSVLRQPSAAACVSQAQRAFGTGTTRNCASVMLFWQHRSRTKSVSACDRDGVVGTAPFDSFPYPHTDSAPLAFRRVSRGCLRVF